MKSKNKSNKKFETKLTTQKFKIGNLVQDPVVKYTKETNIYKFCCLQ